ncbi:MAG: hypothetical protein M0Z60_08430 [Nitrospiraceae bacterium]|nr:hypothetical protein [Nitrospiraceae bacterium]
MKININVKRRFKINGKEYGSVEEMPDDVRTAFEKAKAGRAADGTKTVTTKTRIVFNGSEYEGIDAMPPDARRLYEQVMKAAEGGAAPSDIDLAEIDKSMRSEQYASESATVPTGRRPATDESSFSPRALVVSIALAALIILLYVLFRGR